MKTFCLALDLVDDADSIREYEQYHESIWPEIKESIFNAGIISMNIYRTGNRLFMIMQTEDSFSLEKKKEMDDANPKVQEWETLMWKYQQALPFAKPGEKWVLMENIFSLTQEEL